MGFLRGNVHRYFMCLLQIPKLRSVRDVADRQANYERCNDHC